MTLIRADRVLEVTATTGVGAYALAGTEAGYQAFAAVCSSSDTIECVVTDDINWEAGLYTFTPGSLARTSIYASSNGGSAVNWGAGNKTIFNDIPAHFFANPIPTVMNPVLTGDVTSPGGSTAATLATVNASPGAYTNASVTVNAKGLVTVATSGTAPVTSVSGTTNRITSTGGATPVIDISASYVGQASLTTLGTITTGVWNAGAVTSSGGVQGTQLTSTVATGTAPLVVASTTLVANLHAATADSATTVTTNANLTGPITSVGNATSIAAQTGTGATFVVDTSPTIQTSLAVTGTETITSASANAFAVGPAGTTNPSFNIDASTASAASGLNLKTAASGSGITLSTIGGTNEGVTFNPKGTGGWTDQYSGGGRRAIRSFSATATQPNSAYIALNKSHSNTVGTFTIVQNGEVCGGIVFGGANGGAGSFDTAAQILGVVDGTPGSSADMPGRLEFYTTPDGSATPAIALTLSSTKIATFASDVNAAGNFISNTAAKGLVLKQGANGKCGTFVCNGITPVTVSNTSIAITDVIIASLNTVGGTVGNVPSVRTITAATGFTIAGSSLDTSTYNYIIISNAA